MPEGPEVHREADRIRARIEGAAIAEVRLVHPSLRRRRASIEGAHVVSVRARGKAMLIEWSSGVTLYSHNQLYGKWFARKGHQPPATHRLLRLAILTARGSAWLYSASELALLESDRLHAHPYLAKLGLEVLDPATREADVHARLREPRFENRSLGALLLDQAFVAGIGNYLRSDILFAARLHPRHRLGTLEPGERRRLGRAIFATTHRAYATAGVTNDPRRVARLRKAGASRSHDRHLAFARAGEPCWRCRTEMHRIEVAGRRLYLCPACQAEPARRTDRRR